MIMLVILAWGLQLPFLENEKRYSQAILILHKEGGTMGIIGFLFNVSNAFWAFIKLAFCIFILGFLAALFVIAKWPEFFNVW